ncbi:MAG: hypothetical protein K1X53_01340 [Candidatus Sumerlaeaceae bacterium]|nr:hypothetical protein [Candidatus Sumerlaeaceae bacterium]
MVVPNSNQLWLAVLGFHAVWWLWSWLHRRIAFSQVAPTSTAGFVETQWRLQWSLWLHMFTIPLFALSLEWQVPSQLHFGGGRYARADLFYELLGLVVVPNVFCIALHWWLLLRIYRRLRAPVGGKSIVFLVGFLVILFDGCAAMILASEFHSAAILPVLLVMVVGLGAIITWNARVTATKPGKAFELEDSPLKSELAAIALGAGFRIQKVTIVPSVLKDPAIPPTPVARVNALGLGGSDSTLLLRYFLSLS